MAALYKAPVYITLHRHGLVAMYSCKTFYTNLFAKIPIHFIRFSSPFHQPASKIEIQFQLM